jgi:hypothetical protein
MNVPFEILVDNEAVRTVKANRDFTCSVSPGRHRVQVRYDGKEARSNEVEVQIGAGQTAYCAVDRPPGLPGERNCGDEPLGVSSLYFRSTGR